MMHAAYNGHLEVVVKLAELGADLATADYVSAVISYERKSVAVTSMLLLFAHVFYYHQREKTVIMWAAEEGHLEVVVKLAELGVDLGAVDVVSTVFVFFFQ